MRSLGLAAVFLCGIACGVKAPPRPPLQEATPALPASQVAADAGPRAAGVDAGQP
jgi:hypothetical protein